MVSRESAVAEPPNHAARTRASRARAALEAATFLAALLVVPVLLLQEYAASPDLLAIARGLDWAIWAIFALELTVLLLHRARPQARLVVLDAVIVALSFPLLPAGFEAIRLARLARLTATLRVLRLVRLATVLTRAGATLRHVTRRHGLVQVGALTLITAIGAAAGFVLAEPSHHSFEEGLWWAITTITTVGYGDYYPVSTTGRLLAVLLMVSGIGLVAVFTASVAAHFVEDDEDQVLAALQRVERRLEALEARLDRADRDGKPDDASEDDHD